MNLSKRGGLRQRTPDIGIKMRRDYKGDPPKVLDRPSRLAVAGVVASALDFSPSISVRCFYNAIPCIVFRGNVPGLQCIFRHENEKGHPRGLISASDYEKRHPAAVHSLAHRQKKFVDATSFSSPRSFARECIGDACLLQYFR